MYMTNWFTCKISYEKMQEDGLLKKVTEAYLVDALSYAEAEARITEKMKPYISGDFTVSDIRRTRLAELFQKEDGRFFYCVKAAFIVLNEKTGEGKRILHRMIVGGNTLEEASGIFVESMKGQMVDYTIVSVSETPILGVFPYNGREVVK